MKLAGGGGALKICFLTNELEEQQKAAEASKKRVVEIQVQLRKTIAEKDAAEEKLEEGGQTVQAAAGTTVSSSNVKVVVADSGDSKEGYVSSVEMAMRLKEQAEEMTRNFEEAMRAETELRVHEEEMKRYENANKGCKCVMQ